MSFQDVGKPGASTNRSPQKSGWNQSSAKASSASTEDPAGYAADKATEDLFRQLSDGILQYQRNVGILERIVGQIGTKADGPELQTQLDAQLDVVKELGKRLESQLRQQQRQLANLSDKAQASKGRSTYTKLQRDFQKVELALKNLVLETRRKRAKSTESNPLKLKETEEQDAGLTNEEQRIALELQLQQESLNEEIMREREEEIRNINRGMHQVNEIYKDLAHIVNDQQEQIDQVEQQMDEAKVNAERGLAHIHKANEKAAQSQCTIS